LAAFKIVFQITVRSAPDHFPRFLNVEYFPDTNMASRYVPFSSLKIAKANIPSKNSTYLGPFWYIERYTTICVKGSRKNKFAMLGVEAPVRQDVKTQAYLSSVAFSQRRRLGCIGF
jgi:hypothetical protein